MYNGLIFIDVFVRNSPFGYYEVSSGILGPRLVVRFRLLPTLTLIRGDATFCQILKFKLYLIWSLHVT